MREARHISWNSRCVGDLNALVGREVLLMRDNVGSWVILRLHVNLRLGLGLWSRGRVSFQLCDLSVAHDISLHGNGGGGGTRLVMLRLVQLRLPLLL